MGELDIQNQHLTRQLHYSHIRFQKLNLNTYDHFSSLKRFHGLWFCSNPIIWAFLNLIFLAISYMEFLWINYSH
jgi:hypothetical protein